jgi:hypothetical protein
MESESGSNEKSEVVIKNTRQNEAVDGTAVT